jgi:G patch domain-containing protein 1
MDEEDLREAEETRNLATADGFAGFGSTEQDSTRATGPMDILRPSGETVGSKLLKRMGWKEGQGIGPKVRRKANAGDGELESEESHLFAPNNSPMISFSRKTDHKGLGYEGEVHLGTNVSSNTTTTKLASEDDEDILPAANLLAPKRATAKSAGNRGFGVGVLNDTGSDDEDPYEVGPKVSYNKVIGGDKKSKRRKDGVQTNANPLVKTRPVFLSKKLLSTKTSGLRRSRDGRLPLDGFVLADELDSFASISIQEDSLKPPIVPVGWKSTKTTAVSAKSQACVSTADAARASALNAQRRAALLGEKPLPGKSVFDFLSPAARNKLASTSGRADLPQAGSKSPPPGYEAIEEDRQEHQQNLVPQLDAQVALQALSRGVGGWMPYSEDPSKRDRYRSFLEIRAGLLDQLPARAANATQEDWVNEMNEFARAAQVFKPVTGLMASRFTSSSAALRSPHEQSDNAAGEALLQKPIPKPEDPAVAAAKMGMFGPLTRSTINFYPTRLVCKRFNVQPPENAIDSGNGNDTGNSRRSKPSQFDEYQCEAGPAGSVVPAINDMPHREEPSRGATPREEVVVNVDLERNEALEKARPGQDVFRAVFGSDDEDDD